MGMLMTMWLDYANTQHVSQLRKGLLLVPTIVFPLSIGYSRFILGVHSLDQIIFGLLLGLWVAATMQYCIRPRYDAHITKLLKNETKHFKELIIKNFVIEVLVIGI